MYFQRMPGKRRRSLPLSKADREAIALLWRRGFKQGTIADRFEITQARVSQIVRPKA